MISKRIDPSYFSSTFEKNIKKEFIADKLAKEFLCGVLAPRMLRNFSCFCVSKKIIFFSSPFFKRRCSVWKQELFLCRIQSIGWQTSHYGSSQHRKMLVKNWFWVSWWKWKKEDTEIPVNIWLFAIFCSKAITLYGGGKLSKCSVGNSEYRSFWSLAFLLFCDIRSFFEKADIICQTDQEGSCCQEIKAGNIMPLSRSECKKNSDLQNVLETYKKRENERFEYPLISESIKKPTEGEIDELLRTKLLCSDHVESSQAIYNNFLPKKSVFLAILLHQMDNNCLAKYTNQANHHQHPIAYEYLLFYVGWLITELGMVMLWLMKFIENNTLH